MPQTSFTLIDPQTQSLAFKISSFTDGSYFDTLQRRNFFSMILVTKGCGTVRRDETEYHFQEKSLIGISIYQPFIIKPDDELEGVLINFHPSFLCLFKHRNEVNCNGVLFNNLYDTPVVSLNEDEMQALYVIAEQLTGEMQKHDSPDQDILLSYLKIFMISASRAKIEQRKAEAVQASKKPLLADLVKEAIDTNYKTLHTAADYAELLHVSVKMLNNVSKAWFDKTLTSLIAEKMVIEAKRELYLTAKPVKQIAFEAGYRDEFYFSRFFKKNVGVSPQVFRDTVGFDKLNA